MPPNNINALFYERSVSSPKYVSTCTVVDKLFHDVLSFEFIQRH